MPFTVTELSKLTTEIRRPFLTSYSGTLTGTIDATPYAIEGRDQVWDRRRNTRHRRSQPWLPSNFGIQNANVRYRDSLPEFVINKTKQRLGANDFKMQMHVPGDAGPALSRKAETVEDFLRGAWAGILDPTDALHRRVREHLAADGRGCIELEMLPDYVPPPRGELDADEYDQNVLDGRREYGLPVRALAPDPRSLYWPIGEKMSMVVKVVNRQLIDVADNWSANGFRLTYQQGLSGPGGSGKVVKMPYLGGEMMPTPSAADYGQMVRIVRFVDNNYIYDACYPQTAPAGSYAGAMFGDAPGQTPQLELLGVYKHPFGRPPFFFATARNTADPNPAYADYPLALEILEMADQMNQVMSIRQLKAFMQALMPTQYRPLAPDGTRESTGPKRIENLIQPGFIEAMGTFLAIPTTEAPEFENLVEYLSKTQGSYNMGISGALQEGQVGRGTAAWSMLLVGEEQVAFIQEALDSLSSMRKEASEALLRICKVKAEDGPIVIRTERRSKKQPADRADVEHSMKAADFEGPFRLSVSIDALTQSQRAARTEYGRKLWEEGSISKQTYLEDFVGIDDVEQEMARQRREMLMAPLEKAAQLIGLQKASNEWYALIGEPIVPILQAVGLPAPQGRPMMPPEVPAGMLPAGQAGPAGSVPGEPTEQMNATLANGPDVPGQGLSIQQPEPAAAMNAVG